MIYSVKTLVILVQVGTHLWMNPAQIIGLRAKENLHDPDCRTCIGTANSVCVESDWPLEKIIADIKAAQK